MPGVLARSLPCACSSYHCSHSWRLYMVSPDQLSRVLMKYKRLNFLLMYRDYYRRCSGTFPESRIQREPHLRSDPVVSGFLPKAMVPQTGATHLSPIFGRCGGPVGNICMVWLDRGIPKFAASIMRCQFLRYMVCPQPSNRLVVHYRVSRSGRSGSILEETTHEIFRCPAVKIYDI